MGEERKRNILLADIGDVVYVPGENMTGSWSRVWRHCRPRSAAQYVLDCGPEQSDEGQTSETR